MPESVQIHRIEPFRALAAAGAVARIWREATPGADDEAAISLASGTFPKHVGWPGFRLYIAAIDDVPIGFIYGYRTAPGQWWHDQIAEAMSAAGYASWLSSAVELAEVAVLPAFQGRGVGTRLMEAFLHDTASAVLLATEAHDVRAKHLYEGHGFRPLISDFTYIGFPDDHIVIMGRAARENSPA